MDHRTLVQRRPKRPVQAILQVEIAVPADHVREQVTVEGRVLGQDHLQIEDILGGDELIQPDRARRDLRPFAGSPVMVRIGPSVPDLLKDHVPSLDEQGGGAGQNLRVISAGVLSTGAFSG